MYEDYRTFNMVQVFGRKPGQVVAITSAYDAAKFLLEERPIDAGLKLTTAKQILLKCLAGECSAAVARVAFVEAAREADIFVEAQARPVPTGKRSAAKDTIAAVIGEHMRQWSHKGCQSVPSA